MLAGESESDKSIRRRRKSTQATKHGSEGIHIGLKPNAGFTKSPRQGYQLPHKKGIMPSKNFLNFFFIITPACSHNIKLLTKKALGKTAGQEVARDSSGAC